MKSAKLSGEKPARAAALARAVWLKREGRTGVDACGCMDGMRVYSVYCSYWSKTLRGVFRIAVWQQRRQPGLSVGRL
jgi:hypothetical protein